MMSSAAWGMPCLLICHVAHGQRHGSILLRRLAL
jgi:hypothetical protein